ncbi:MAG: hypothetical protein SOV55_02640, partial [Candidatus Borkfalkiaceae bacterium]|nr:hypothetical protein [Christensenellaceae bacterium]
TESITVAAFLPCGIFLSSRSFCLKFICRSRNRKYRRCRLFTLRHFFKFAQFLLKVYLPQPKPKALPLPPFYPAAFF